MADFATMTVDGLDDIEKMMKELPRRNQKKIKRGALRAGARPIVQAQREKIDEIPDNRLNQSGKKRFKKAVGTVTSKSRLFESKVYVGPRYAGAKNIAPEAHLFEFGTEDRVTKSGENRGRIVATPFIRPAWEEKKVEAVRLIREELLDRTLQEAVKLSKVKA